MEDQSISTGNKELDMFLTGGYDRDIITTLYGPSGSAKTTLAIIATISVVRQGKKVIYIDTESSFSVERLKQISGEDYREIMKNVLFLKPVNFKEQEKSFSKLRGLVDDTIGLIVVDTISMLYRLEMGQSKDIYEVNKKLGRQLSFLAEITRKRKIPVLVTNQVYCNFEDKNCVNMVGGDILKYGSKTLLELQCMNNGVRCMIIRKCRRLPEKRFFFKLVNSGIEKCEKVL